MFQCIGCANILYKRPGIDFYYSPNLGVANHIIKYLKLYDKFIYNFLDYLSPNYYDQLDTSQNYFLVVCSTVIYLSLLPITTNWVCYACSCIRFRVYDFVFDLHVKCIVCSYSRIPTIVTLVALLTYSSVFF